MCGLARILFSVIDVWKHQSVPPATALSEGTAWDPSGQCWGPRPSPCQQLVSTSRHPSCLPLISKLSEPFLLWFLVIETKNRRDSGLQLIKSSLRVGEIQMRMRWLFPMFVSVRGSRDVVGWRERCVPNIPGVLNRIQFRWNAGLLCDF